MVDDDDEIICKYIDRESNADSFPIPKLVSINTDYQQMEH